MNAVRIIGIGSPLGADRAGWQVAEALRVDRRIADAVEVVLADRPGVGLLHLFEAVGQVILVDALLDVRAAASSTPRWLLRDELETLATSCSSHALGVSEALVLAETLAVLPPQLAILGIPVAGHSEASAVDPQMIAHAVGMIHARLQAMSPVSPAMATGTPAESLHGR